MHYFGGGSFSKLLKYLHCLIPTNLVIIHDLIGGMTTDFEDPVKNIPPKFSEDE